MSSVTVFYVIEQAFYDKRGRLSAHRCIDGMGTRGGLGEGFDEWQNVLTY